MVLACTKRALRGENVANDLTSLARVREGAALSLSRSFLRRKREKDKNR
jgi:hypothetical protein